jgi:hypothetical protein
MEEQCNYLRLISSVECSTSEYNLMKLGTKTTKITGDEHLIFSKTYQKPKA